MIRYENGVVVVVKDVIIGAVGHGFDYAGSQVRHSRQRCDVSPELCSPPRRWTPPLVTLRRNTVSIMKI